MFEKFTDHVSVMRIAAAGNTQKLKKLIEAGCNLNRRTGLDPWMTPLDAAVASGHLECVEMLVAGGAHVTGSAICEAIVRDSTEVLDIFAKDDIRFYQKFRSDGPRRGLNPNNPKLNNWTGQFTALDFAVSFDSQRCTELLVKMGAPHHEHVKLCSPFLPIKDDAGKVIRPLPGEKWQFYRQRCFAILIESEEFVTRRGANFDGLSMVTTGYYCAKCASFLKK
jgi:ankyrin repeat protein